MHTRKMFEHEAVQLGLPMPPRKEWWAEYPALTTAYQVDDCIGIRIRKHAIGAWNKCVLLSDCEIADAGLVPSRIYSTNPPPWAVCPRHRSYVVIQGQLVPVDD